MDALLNMLYFGAFIAINLAVMNLLPIPALDGGRVVGLLISTAVEALTRKKINPKYEGYLHGAGMLLLCALILWLMGDLDFAFAKKIPVFYILAFFAGFVIQGMSEEVCVRGYLMVSLGNRCHMAVAIGISSVVFALLHLGNPGLTVLALLNLTLFGVFMAVYILRTDDLWGACAIHSAWNFAQGNLVGIRVSGTAQLPTVAIMQPLGEQSLFHGGDFGLEGGLIVTIVVLAAIALTLFLPQKQHAEKSVL
jgi:membrane protease YdiL (CAAX protease family)